MLNDFIHLRRSIDSILLTHKSLEHLELADNDWYALARYKKVFEIFNMPTIVLQGKFFEEKNLYKIFYKFLIFFRIFIHYDSKSFAIYL
jgi:hypothetical protein